MQSTEQEPGLARPKLDKKVDGETSGKSLVSGMSVTWEILENTGCTQSQFVYSISR